MNIQDRASEAYYPSYSMGGGFLRQNRHEIVLQNPERRVLFDYKCGTRIEARKDIFKVN